MTLSVELGIALNDWEGEGVYNPRDFVSRSTISSLDDSSNLLVEADRYRWIGCVLTVSCLIVFDWLYYTSFLIG